MEFLTDHPIGNMLGWWELAGVDASFSDTPGSWLERPEAKPVVQAAQRHDAAVPYSEMPDTLSEFLDWLKNSPDVPEASWSSMRLLPVAEPRDIMVISDVPDQEDMQAETLFSGNAGQLLQAMLRAIGLSRDAVYLCSLASARPPGGLLDPASIERLKLIMQRHISLAAPRHILLLGDKTSRALLAADTQGARGKLQSINHGDGTISVIATFHPRLLLKQPAAKAECWKDLQMFARGIAS